MVTFDYEAGRGEGGSHSRSGREKDSIAIQPALVIIMTKLSRFHNTIHRGSKYKPGKVSQHGVYRVHLLVLRIWIVERTLQHKI